MPLPPPLRVNHSNHLKAQGNLSYQDFLRLVGKLWVDAHPGIPLIATGDKSFAQYPQLIYRLDLRKVFPTEPKPRYREEVLTAEGEDAIVIYAQRFQSVITFSAITQTDPYTCETLIEEFQDFMIEMQPVFKELGASELVFMRRLPDFHDDRPGESIIGRSVSYMLTTETIIKSTVKKLEQIIVDARSFLLSNQMIFHTNLAEQTIIVSGASFKIGDRVMITHRPDSPLPFPAGFYLISNLVTINNGTQYTLAQWGDAATPSYGNVTFTHDNSTGYISLAPEANIETQITDEFFERGE